jgi:hypothetical protein
MHHFLGYVAEIGVFGHFWTFMGAIWAPQNALTILVVMRNFHYLINNNEAKWKAVVRYCLEVLVERPLGMLLPQ